MTTDIRAKMLSDEEIRILVREFACLKSVAVNKPEDLTDVVLRRHEELAGERDRRM